VILLWCVLFGAGGFVVGWFVGQWRGYGFGFFDGCRELASFEDAVVEDVRGDA
jgi:hypothetical protein